MGNHRAFCTIMTGNSPNRRRTSIGGLPLLREKGVSEEIIEAIAGHADTLCASNKSARESALCL